MGRSCFDAAGPAEHDKMPFRQLVFQRLTLCSLTGTAHEREPASPA
jgi:hypothetical protein